MTRARRHELFTPKRWTRQRSRKRRRSRRGQRKSKGSFEALERRELLSVNDLDGTIFSATWMGAATLEPEVVTGTIGSDDGVASFDSDVDLYALTVRAGQTIDVSVAALARDSPLRSRIRVFDAEGVELADASGTDRIDPSVTVTFANDGPHYLGISGDHYGNYDPRQLGDGPPEHESWMKGDYRLTIASSPRLGDEQPVSHTVAGDQTSHAFGIDEFGRSVHVYLSNDSGETGLYVQRWDTDGNSLGTLALDHEVHGEPLIAVAPTGDFVIAWPELDGGTHVLFAQYFRVDGELTSASDPMWIGELGGTAAVAINARGDFVVGWNDQGHVRLRQFTHTDNSHQAGVPYAVDGATGGNQRLASSHAVQLADDGQVHALWLAEELLLLGGFDAAGQPTDPAPTLVARVPTDLRVHDDHYALTALSEETFLSHGELARAPDGRLFIAGQWKYVLELVDRVADDGDVDAWYERYQNFVRVVDPQSGVTDAQIVASGLWQQRQSGGGLVSEGDRISPPAIALDRHDRWAVAWQQETFATTAEPTESHQTIRWYSAHHASPLTEVHQEFNASPSLPRLESDGQGTYVLASRRTHAASSDGDLVARTFRLNTPPQMVERTWTDTLVAAPEAADNPGISVMELAADFADHDAGTQFGIAIVAGDESRGPIQYSADAGTTWHDASFVSDREALLLPARADYRVRVSPHSWEPGTITEAIVFRAWDMSRGKAASHLDVSASDGTSVSQNTNAIDIVLSPSRGDAYLVNVDHTAGVQFGVATGIDGLGRVVHVYRDYHAEPRLRIQRMDAEGQPLTHTELPLSDANDPTIAVTATGDFVVAWSTYNGQSRNYDVFAQFFDVVGDEVLPREIQFVGESFQRSAAVAINDNGDFAVVWSAESQRLVFREFVHEGHTHTATDMVMVDDEATSPQTLPSQKAVDYSPRGDLHFLWVNGRQLLTRTWTDDATLGAVQVVTTTEDFDLEIIDEEPGLAPSSDTTVVQGELAIAPDGAVYVAGQYARSLLLTEVDGSRNRLVRHDQYQNFARRFSPHGDAGPITDLLASHRRFEIHGRNRQAEGTVLASPSIAADSQHRWGVVWREDGYSGSASFSNATHAVLVRWYDAVTNTPLGAGHLISDAHVSQTVLTANAVGTYLATSQTLRTVANTGAIDRTTRPASELTASAHDIVAQRLDPGPFVPVNRQAPRFQPVGDQVVGLAATLTVPLRVEYAAERADRLDFSVPEDLPGAQVEVDAGDPTRATFTWDAPAEEGVFLLRVQVADADDPTRADVVAFQVFVGAENQPPRLVPLHDASIVVGERLTFPVFAEDPDAPARLLRFELAGDAPAGATIHPSSGTFSWTPSATQLGTHAVPIIVTDQGFPPLSDLAMALVTVRAPNQRPLIAAPDQIELGENGTFVFEDAHRITVSDADGSGDLWLSISAEHGSIQLDSVHELAYLSGGTQPARRLKVRGTPSALNLALEGMTFWPDPGFHGQTTLQLTLSDEGNGGTHPHAATYHTLRAVVHSAVDAPQVPDQTLYFVPTAVEGAAEVVGDVHATDPDPTHVRSFRITAGNDDLAFTIDPANGRLFAVDDDVMSAGSERVLTVEAYYDDLPSAPAGAGAVTVHRAPDHNLAPTATPNAYTLDEGTWLAGHLLTDGSPDTDFDGDAIELTGVFDARHRPIPWGVPTVLTTGAVLTVAADGSFHFDASFDHLNAGLGPGDPHEFRNETLSYVIVDEHGADRQADVYFTITPVNDLHAVADQQFTVSPRATVGDTVGRLLVHNPEADEYFSYQFTSGNVGNVFRLVEGGEIQLNNASPLAAGQVYDLTVDVIDSNGTPVAASVTIEVADNQPPELHDLRYTTSADLPTIGNVLVDTQGQGAAFDAEGDALQVVMLDDSAFAIGRGMTLPDGATIRIDADGSFAFDPSGSDFLHRLPADQTHARHIPYLVRDARGGTAAAELTIEVTGYNRAPQAFDNHYALTNDQTAAGNLILDPTSGNRSDHDPNVDALRMVRIGSIAVGEGTTQSTTYLGATISVTPDGLFVYDPSQLDLAGRAPGDRVYDAISYTIDDGFGEQSTAVARFEIQVRDPLPTPFVVDALGLANDTITPGGNDHDLQTEDPRIAGRLAGAVAEAATYAVEFDVAAAPGGTWQLSAALSVDATVPLDPSDPNFPAFDFDPRTSGAFGSFGTKSIAYRAVAYDIEGTVLQSSPWDYLQFEWLEAADAGPLRVSDIRLFNDTGWIDPDTGGIAPPDNQTTDPRIAGEVRGDFDLSSLAGGDTRVVEITFSHERAGMMYEGTVSMDGAGSFLYDPRTVDAGLATETGATLTIDYTANLVEHIAGVTTRTPLGSDFVEFFYFSIPASCGSVTLEEASDAPARETTRMLVGSAGWAGSNCLPSAEQTYVEFDLSDAWHGFDGLPDADTVVVLDEPGLAAPPHDQSASFRYTIAGLLGGQAEVRARVKEWSSTYGDYQLGPWSPALTLAAPESPAIAAVNVEYDDVSGRRLPRLTGYLVGAADDVAGNETFDPASVGQVPVEFFHRNEGTFSENWPPNGRVITDTQGHFEYAPRGLAYDDYEFGGSVWARTVSRLGDGSEVYGAAWRVAAVVVDRPALPQLSEFRLFDEAAADWIGGRWQTEDTRTQGSLSTIDPAGVGVQDVHLEFAHDLPEDPGDDELSVGFADPDDEGVFQYAPVLGEGPIDIRARIAYFDTYADEYAYSGWSPLALPLDVQASTNELAEVVEFELAVPAAGTSNPSHTDQPVVTGRIENPDGYVGYVDVEFRDSVSLADLGTTQTDEHGVFTYWLPGLATNQTHTIEARALDWDYPGQRAVAGPWTTDDLVFFLDGEEPPEVIRLELLSDTGSIAGETANPALLGQISGSGELEGIPIAIDHGDDGSFETLVETDARGWFTYFPEALDFGSHVFRASVAVWNADLGGFDYSVGQPLSFTLQSQPNAAATITSIGLAHPPAHGGISVSDATIVGRIANEAALADITMEFDFDLDDTNGVNQTTVTDALGQFELRPVALDPGMVEIRARTVERDAATASYLRSEWTSIPAFDYQPLGDLPPTVTLQLVDPGDGQSPPVVSDPTVSGFATNDDSLDGLVVEFTWSNDLNAAVIGTVPVQPFGGGFTFQPGGLEHGHTYTLWARAREPLTDGSWLYGPPTSVDFSFASDVATDLHVATLGLTNDTAAPGGSTTDDGSTSDAHMTGQVAWSTGDVGGLTVNFDFDEYAWTIDATAITASDGSFTFDYPVGQPGFYSLRAQAVYPEGGVSGWTVSNFVYDTDASSPRALALVAALSTIDPAWQTADDLDFETISQLAEEVFRASAANADASLDRAMALAELIRDGVESTLQRDYEIARQQADQSYRNAVLAAEAHFATALAILPASQRATYALAPFQWPTAAFDNSLVIPDDGLLAPPPARPSSDGPKFDPFSDPAYRQAVWMANQQFLQQLRAAEEAYRDALDDVENNNQLASDSAHADYTEAARQAHETYRAALAVRPEFDNAALQEQEDRISAAWQEYLAAKVAADELRNRLNQDTQQRAQAARNNVHADQGARYNALHDALPEWPTTTQVNRFNDRVHDLHEQYDPILSRIDAEEARALREADRDYTVAVAHALQQAQQIAYDARRAITEITRRHQHAELTTDVVAAEQLAQDLATARADYEKEIADLDHDRGKALAHEAFVRDETRAQATRTREQSLAVARLNATEQWSSAIGTPWSLFQSQVARLQKDHRLAVIELEFQRDIDLAHAQRAETEAKSRAQKDRAKAIADAERDRAIAISDESREFRLGSSEQFVARDLSLADNWTTRLIVSSQVEEVRTVEIANINLDENLATIAAAEANYQPLDVWHVECTGTICVGPSAEWQSTLHVDNSEVRFRNAQIHLRATEAARQDATIARADADETRTAALIDATEQYRQAANDVIHETTVALADLTFTFQVETAELQDDFNLALASAAASYATDQDTATAGRFRRDIAAVQRLKRDQADVQRMFDNQLAQAHQSHEWLVAEGYVSRVVAWSQLVPAAWGDYHIGLAMAELEHVGMTTAAATRKIERGGDLRVARANDEAGLALVFANAVYGTEGAYHQRAAAIAEGTVQIAADQSLASYVESQAEAARDYDRGVAEATLAYRQSVVAEDANRDRALNEALTDKAHRLARANYQSKIEPETVDLAELTRLANAAYVILAAQTNADRILIIEQQRKVWKETVAELRVTLVEAIVAAQAERAEQLHAERTTVAEAVAAGTRIFGRALAAAESDRNIASTQAEADENVGSVANLALYSYDIAEADAALATQQSVARSNYTNRLHSDHFAAAASDYAAQPSADAGFFLAVAAADRTRAIAEANSELLRTQAIGQWQVANQQAINAADIAFAERSAEVNLTTARLQARRHTAQAASLSAALASLYLRNEIAQADLVIGSTAAQGAADIAYARAIQDREVAQAVAEFAFVERIVPAYHAYHATCGSKYWYWQEDCQATADEYSAEYEAAIRERDEAFQAARDVFEDVIYDIEFTEDNDTAKYRYDFIVATGTARSSFAFSQAIAMEAQAEAEFSLGVASLVAQQQAAAVHNDAQQAAEYLLVSAIGQQDVAHQQRLLAANSEYGTQRGLAEADLQIARAEGLSNSWQALATAHPTNDELGFQAARSRAYATWLREMKLDYVIFQSAARTAQYQFNISHAVTTAEYASTVAAIDWDHSVLLSGQAQRRAVHEAIAIGESSIVAARNLGTLFVHMADADQGQAARYLRADTTYEAEYLRVQEQLAADNDFGAYLDGGAEADSRRRKAFAYADAAWRVDVAEGEFRLNLAEAARQLDLSLRLALVANSIDSERADADAAQQRALARATADRRYRAVQHANTRRESLALANANLLTASRNAQVAASGQLDGELSIPWSDYAYRRAIAEQAAWQARKNDFLNTQAEISQAELGFATQRLGAYRLAAEEMALINSVAQQQLATTATDKITQAAGEQVAFSVAIAQLTHEYRTQLTQLQLTRDVNIADLASNHSLVEQEFADAKDALEQATKDTDTQFRRTRREELARIGLELTNETAALQAWRGSGHTQAQARFDQTLAAAQLSADAQSGLAATRADLQFAQTTSQAAALADELAGLPSSPWVDLAVADWTARQEQVIQPLAELGRQQQRALAEASNAYHVIVGTAAHSQAELAIQLRATLDRVSAASDLALVTAYVDEERDLPGNLEPPTPDLGVVSRSTHTYVTNYPGIIDIESYAHGYWGGLYWGDTWGVGHTFNPGWLWSGFGRYDYGWGFANFTSNYGFGGDWYSFWNSGGFTNTLAYQTYTPWSFGSGSGWWTGNYTPAPLGLDADFRIDLAAELDQYGTSINQLTTGALDRLGVVVPGEDGQPPLLDATAHSIQLGDTHTAFAASRPADVPASITLDDFLVDDQRGSFSVTHEELDALSGPVVQTATDVLPAANEPTAAADLQPYDFGIRFALFRQGNLIFLRELEKTLALGTGNMPVPAYSPRNEYLVGRLDQASGWVTLETEFGGGRATLSALGKAATRWNSSKMESILTTVLGPEGLARQRPQVRQLIDGVRSPFEINPGASSLGIFLGGTNMHFYGVGNVEKMYHMYQGSKFYYGGVGNVIDSRFSLGPDGGPGETIAGATALFEFNWIMDRAERDVVDYFQEYGATRLDIYGWSRGAAEAIELARRLDGRGIHVNFIGAYDPVYSVGVAGQQSWYIQPPTNDGKQRNYVSVTVSDNVDAIAVIYAMNEVRSWFPATLVFPEGSSTEVIRIGSPGAHGEVGGHFQSNLMVQRLNLHQMIHYTPGGNVLFQNQALEPQVAAIYNSVYTTYAALRDVKDITSNSLIFAQSKQSKYWANLSSRDYISLANSKIAKWQPSPLAAQANTVIVGGNHWLNSPNALYLVEIKYEKLRLTVAGITAIATNGLVNPYDLSPQLGAIDQPIKDFFKRDIESWMEMGLWDLYAGIDEGFIRSLYDLTIDPFDGGYRNDL